MQQATLLAPASPSVSLVNDRPATTSLEVAKFFGKRHDDVLKSIRNLRSNCPESFHARNFAEMSRTVEIGNGATREEVYFILYRDGFMLLVMGYTGKQAMQIKIAYIEAFNAMEAELVEQAKKTLPTAKTKKPAQKALPKAEQKALPAPKLTIEEDIQLFAEEVKQAHAEVYALQKQASEKLVARTMGIMASLAAGLRSKAHPSDYGKISIFVSWLLPHVLDNGKEALHALSEHLLSFQNPATILMDYVNTGKGWTKS